jgi:hypothetical protein
MIRHVIAQAIAGEARTGSLRRYFEHRLEELETRLELPAKDPVDALVSFTRRYIEYVPQFLEHLREQANAAGMEQPVGAFLNMAEDFFLAPPDDLEGESGLHALLDEAFLAQRLIEEANDRFWHGIGRPLVNVDMTRANIIAHHLVGEPLATRLELLVARSIGMLARHLGQLSGAGERSENQEGLEVLPCMSREVAVGLRLDSA